MTVRLPLAALAAVAALSAPLLSAGDAHATTPSPWTVSSLDSFTPDASDMSGADRPRVAIDPAGDAVAVWIRPLDANTHEVLAASRQAGGSFGTPETITTNGIASDLQVAMDASGTATIAWTERTSLSATTTSVQTATRGAGASTWAIATPGDSANSPRLAENAAGDAVLAWSAGGGTQGHVLAAIRHGAGAWGSPVQLGDGARPAAAIDRQGNALVAWSLTAGQGGADSQIQTARYDAAAASWGTVQLVDNFANACPYTPRLAFSLDGSASLLYSTGDCAHAGFASPGVFAADRPAGVDAGWGPFAKLESLATRPSVAGLETGVAGIWDYDGALEGAVEDTGGWGSPWWLSGNLFDTLGGSTLVPDGAGGAAAAWTNGDGMDAQWLPAGGDFTTSPSEQISALRGGQPDLAVAGPGRAVAAWAYNDGGPASNDAIEVAVRTAPVSTQPPSCAARATRTPTGQAVRVALSCVDASGLPLTISVDGGPAHGTLGTVDSARQAVTYTPAAGFSGSDSFSYHATDAHGLASTPATVTVDVVAPPPPPPPPPPAVGGGGSGSTGGSGGGGSSQPVTSGAPAADCPTQVTAGLVQLAGCFTSVDAQLQAGGSVTLRGKEEAVATGRVTMNGLLVVPDSASTHIKVWPTLIQSDGAVSVYAGPVKISHGNLTLTLPDATAAQWVTPEEVFTPPSGSTLYGLSFVGDLAPTFTRDGQAILNGGIALPFGLNLLADSDVQLVTTVQSGLQESTIDAHREELMVGPVDVKKLDVSYDPIGDTWKGSAQVQLPTPNPLLVGAGVSFQHGKFKSVEGEVDSLNFEITPGLFLQRIKLGMGVDPLTIGGGLGVSGGPEVDGKTAVRVDGDFSYTFSTPGRLRVDGTLTLVDFEAAHAFLEYLTSGSISFGGDLQLGLPDTTPDNFDKQPVQIKAYINGFVDGPTFDVEAAADLNILGKQVGGDLLASTKGMAGCGKLYFVQAGFGYDWATHHLTVMGPFACDVGDWRVFPPTGVDVTPGSAADLAAAGHRTSGGIRLGVGPVVLRLRGAGGLPKVRLIGPGGQSIAVPAGTQPVANDSFVVLQDPHADTTYVAIHRPRGARWSVTLEPGSPRLRDIAGASVLPDPSVSARVSGRGRTRTLSYRVAARAGQQVRFLEIGPQTRRVIATVSDASGTIRFVPGDGSPGLRRIVATVIQNGLPRAQQTVATYLAPAPIPVASPRGLRVRAHGRTLLVGWNAAHAGVAHWLVTARLTSGVTRWVTVPGSTTAVTFPDLVAERRASVTVTGVAGDGRRGHPASASLRVP